MPCARNSLSSEPTVSVVVNTCDRREPLRVLLASLEHQSWPAFEVVVVVGPTRDDTVEMLAEDFDGRVVVVRCPEANLSQSRNLGIAAAVGDLVAYVDDDAVPSPLWLEQLALAFAAEPDLQALGGRTYNVRNGTVQFLNGMATTLGEQWDVREPTLVPDFRSPAETWFPRLHGCNMCYRRPALVTVGGFDEHYAYIFEEPDLAARLRHAGLRLAHSSDAVVYHAPATGRNRGRHPYDLDWYNWIRSTVYFTLKNASEVSTLERWRAALGHGSRLFSLVDDLRRQESIDGELERKARRALRSGLLSGWRQGLLGRRRLARLPHPPDRPLLSFPQTVSSRRQAVAPVGSPPPDMTPLDQEPLRLALLSADFPPHNTHGVARHTFTLARALARRGHEVHVLARGEQAGTAARHGFLEHHVVARSRRRYARWAEQGFPGVTHRLDYSHAVHDKLLDLERNHRLQLADSPLWNLDGLVPVVAGRLPVAVRIVTSVAQLRQLHRDTSPELELLAALERQLLERADAVIANSRASRRILSELYSLEPDLAPVIPFGEPALADTEIVPLAQRDREQVHLLFVGRLEQRKGILDLFAALPGLLARHPQLRVSVVGSDNSAGDGMLQRSGKSYPDLFLEQHPALAERVSFLGHVDDECLFDLYRDCDLLTAPSLYESFGLILIEAMNHARPVVACRAGGPEDIVADEETGLLVSPGVSAELEAALERLVGSREARIRMAEAGRRRFLDKFTDTRMAEAFEQTYREMLVRSEPSRRAP